MEESTSSRPKRSSKPPSKFVPWEEGEAAMVSERKKRSRARGEKKSRSDQLEKKKLYMRNYRAGTEEESGNKNLPEAGDSGDDGEREQRAKKKNLENKKTRLWKRRKM